MLQDMLILAVNDGLTKIEKETERTMGKYTKRNPRFIKGEMWRAVSRTDRTINRQLHEAARYRTKNSN